MKFKNIFFFFLFLLLIGLIIYEYFFMIIPLQLENKDLKRENEVLMVKLSKELENLKIYSKDTSTFNLPEPLIKAKEELSKEFNVESKENEIRITILTDELFLPGNYILSKDGEKKLLKIAEFLKEFPYKEIELQVHTDDVPVSTNKEIFPTNWELSARRGTEIIRFLISKGGIPKERVYVSAFGDSRPLIPPDTKEARKKNKRAVFVIKL